MVINVASAGPLETRLPSVAMARPTRPAIGADQAFPHDGRMNFLDNQVDAGTGTIRARAVFANPAHALTPGLFVRLRVPGTGSYGGALVRDSAIGTDLDKRYVLIVTKDRIVEQRPVTLGPNLDGLRVVRAGVSAGDLVVVNGLQRVRPGMKVEPVNVPMAAGGAAAEPGASSPAPAGK